MSKKFLVYFISIIMSLTIITSCTTKTQNSSDITSSRTSAQTVITENSDTSDADTSSPTKTDKKRVYFVGPFDTSYHSAAESFFSYCSKTKQPFYTGSINSAQTLQMQMSDIKSGKFNEALKIADIVVFCEYKDLKIGTAEALEEIMPLFKEDVKFYFCLTEIDYKERPAELKNIKNITYIPAGYIIKEKLGYLFENNEDFKSEFDREPIYGYITELTIYSVITGKSCIGLPFDSLSSFAIDSLPGKTKEEKQKTIQTIQEKAMEGLEEYASTETKSN